MSRDVPFVHDAFPFTFSAPSEATFIPTPLFSPSPFMFDDDFLGDFIDYDSSLDPIVPPSADVSSSYLALSTVVSSPTLSSGPTPEIHISDNLGGGFLYKRPSMLLRDYVVHSTFNHLIALCYHRAPQVCRLLQ